jgi:DNA-binding CsgD family transcriptional regulator
VSQSPAGTSKRALARIQRLCCLGVGSEMLVPDLMREVMAFIPSRGGLFFWVGPKPEFKNAYTTFSTGILELYLKEFYSTRQEGGLLRPLVEFATWPVSSPVLRFEQQLRVDRRTFLHSDYYNHLWRPVDNCNPLMLGLLEADRVSGVLQVYRATEERPFEPHEVKMLGSIAGFVAHAMTPAALTEEAFIDSDDRALLVADADGRLYHVGPQAQHLLMMALNPHWSPKANWRGLHGPVPDIGRLCRMLATIAKGDIGQPPPVLRLRNAWGEFVFRAYWLGPTDGTEQTRHIGITIERRVPRALALRRLIEELPLTGREKQLCLHLAHDRSRQDLADAMGVSTGTIVTHQSTIYAKLRVHSRAELLAALSPR